MKLISWNKVEVKLPGGWEITREGGTSINGVLVAAPETGAKLEIYWRHSKPSDFPKAYEKYLEKLEKKGFVRKNSFSTTLHKHKVLGYFLRDENNKVFTASWFCDETRRLFIVQLDGKSVSMGLFTSILNNINCHPIHNGMVNWRLMGIGLRLYEDYFVNLRDFKIGYSMAYFMSRDKKVHVIQYSIARYVIESQETSEDDVFKKHLRYLTPRFTKLVLIDKNSYEKYYIVHTLLQKIKYGVLLKKVNKCIKPDYVQYTLVKAPRKRLDEAIDIVKGTYCVEW
ncbi:hypothetical protein Smar_1395 [Staphylothermus marinus F1]|uniref:Uncharacterized protein n=1 Tax=Staphylothermus marinus (strain ATCC 43588 / DSM 3639 / JCM 9404 / F1) TaxID=399550 RepID=A3DPC6_STAMF|nr:hypothetical protein [Staphylothermus marinus]ABN70486.1 hypothetical protein Smar_1395 [Staphylothermus marinus F1]